MQAYACLVDFLQLSWIIKVDLKIHRIDNDTHVRFKKDLADLKRDLV